MQTPSDFTGAGELEWSVLEQLARGVSSESEAARFKTCLQSESLSWGELLEQALRHQLLPLLAYHVFECDLHEKLPHYLNQHLASALNLNRHHLNLLRREAASIASLLQDNSIPFVATKGISLESTVYHGLGTRMLKDIDFMILPEHREQVAQLIGQAGYRPGRFDWKNGGIIAHERRMHINYVMNPDHLVRNARLIEDPCFRYIYIDFANSLTWHKCEYDIPVHEALENTLQVPVPGCEDVLLPCFSPEFQFVFTTLHLFREAWLEQWIELGYDVNLMKFGDVIRLYRAHREHLVQPAFMDMLQRYDIVQPMQWVTEHLDRTFHLDVTDSLGFDQTVDEAWLASAQASRGTERSWSGTMRDRLQSKARASLFK